MKKTLYAFLLGLTAVLIVFSLSGCSLVLDMLSFDDISNVFPGENDEPRSWNIPKIDPGVDPGEYSDGVFCYYYDQLNDKQKTIYDTMLSGAVKGDDYPSADASVGKEAGEQAAKALIYDHRELFAYGCWGYVKYGGSNYIAVSKYDYWEYNSSYSSQKKDFENAVAYVVSEINGKCTTDYEKAGYAHDYIVKYCEYDHDAANAVMNNPEHYPSRYDRIFTAYGCLVDRKAVCAGYASAYKVILDRLGINCVYVTGESKDVGHAWNRVSIDGGNYYVDVTWDDLDERDYPQAVNYQYFNITTDDLLKDHSIDGDFPHPVCRDTLYNYYEYNKYVIREYDFQTFVDMMNMQKDNGAVNIKFADPSDAAKAERDLITKEGYKNITWLGRNFAYVFDTDNGYALILLK